jgi:hypothetical protein
MLPVEGFVKFFGKNLNNYNTYSRPCKAQTRSRKAKEVSEDKRYNIQGNALDDSNITEAGACIAFFIEGWFR